MSTTTVARVHTTRTVTVEIPDGPTVEIPGPIEDYQDVKVVETEQGWRLGWIAHDPDAEDPFATFDDGERIENRYHGRYGEMSAQWARERLAKLPRGQGWRLYLVDGAGNPRRDRISDPVRWAYLVPEDVDREHARGWVDAVWRQWRDWAEGDCYGVATVDVDKDGRVTAEDSLWGYYGLEDAESALAEELG